MATLCWSWVFGTSCFRCVLGVCFIVVYSCIPLLVALGVCGGFEKLAMHGLFTGVIAQVQRFKLPFRPVVTHETSSCPFVVIQTSFRVHEISGDDLRPDFVRNDKDDLQGVTMLQD